MNEKKVSFTEIQVQAGANGDISKTFFQWMKPIFVQRYGATYGVFCSSEATTEKFYPPMLGLHYSYGPADRRTKYEFRVPQGEVFDAIISAIEQTKEINHEMNTRKISTHFGAGSYEISRDSRLIGRVIT